MRILRGKSNLEVSSQGFALFVVGLVLATFFGGAVKTYLASDDVQRRILAELRKNLPNNIVEVERAEVLLSRGSLPGFGLRLHGLTLTQDVCGKLSFVLNVPRATLPVDLISLIRRKPRLGNVRIEQGHLHLDFRPCNPAAPPPAAVAGQVTVPSTPTPVAAPVAKPVIIPKIKVSEIHRFLKSVQLQDFAITYEKSPSWKIVFKNGELDADDEIELQASIDVQKSTISGGTLTHPVVLELRSDRSVFKWDVSSDFKEGHVQLTGALDQEAQGGRIALRLRQVPVKELLSEAYQMGFLDQELKLKSTWISCGAEWEGSLVNYQNAPVAVHDCKVEGGYGRADLAKTDLWLKSDVPFKSPAIFQIRQMQIQPVLEALGREVLPAVLSRLGVWTGQLEFSGKKNWRLEGLLENAEVVFSNRSVRGKQGIEKLRTSFRKQGSQISAKLDGAILREGLAEGTVEFYLEEDWRGGKFILRMPKVQLSPPIQKLLTGGTMSEASVSGDGALVSGELAEWNGVMNLPEASGTGWKTSDLTVKSRYKEGVFFLEPTVKSASADKSWMYFDQVAALLPVDSGSASWTDVAMKVSILKNGGQVEGFTARFGEALWQGKASWIRDGLMTGSLKTGKNSVYTIRGEKGSLRLLQR